MLRADSIRGFLAEFSLVSSIFPSDVYKDIEIPKMSNAINFEFLTSVVVLILVF
jgi:hypothetical protein